MIGWVVDRQSEPGVEFLSLTRRMRPETASALQVAADALSERLRLATHLGIVCSSDLGGRGAPAEDL
ncbi:hypothetical protein [Sediminicurvatus halobius]|uniref:Uncharacterized protein n=1 Tax=Sediminicurvatus halobius TaxID=2182432 RepID=A0A2U2MWH7_9GAMM|nr:hypothetical protein [Spiribacter halobius]PWG61194.1 hypothetical protein DEM34_17590 [Spiribacter halobius]UEX77932.1 hypothetical protein LMH63_18715 [Spiribacter halobius]